MHEVQASKKAGLKRHPQGRLLGRRDACTWPCPLTVGLLLPQRYTSVDVPLRASPP
jgi:hypothetical protein